MNIIAKPKILEYCDKYPNARNALLSWYDTVHKADYSKPQDIQKDWGKDSTLGQEIIVFNIKGNNYRLIARVNYKMRTIFVRWFGTHAEYDRINIFEV